LRPSKESLPQGFAAAARDKGDLVPSGAALLRLPADGIADGPFLRFGNRPFDAVVVDAVTQSMGDMRRFLASVVASLPPGGGILVDAANLQAPRMLHCVLEGRPGAFDAFGSLREPERAVLLRDLVEALELAGVVVGDCVAVPAAHDELRAEFADQMLDEGFLASECIGGTPPARWWVVGRKIAERAGSVLLGIGSDADRARTEAALRAFLPASWEVIRCEGERELESWNRGVAASRGEVLWFLRAGSAPSAELFAGLCAQSLRAPAIPAATGAAGSAVNGLMLARSTLLRVGPLPRRWECEQVGYEHFGLRLAALALAPTEVPGEFASPPDAVRDARTLEREAGELLAMWRGVNERTLRGEVAPARPRAPLAAPWHGREPRLSLCMIARNEEQMLPECLQRARQAVDEIVIVDTGSTDRTPEIAASFGARVLHAPWQDDFAAARNVGLAAATGDWILVLDADERIDPGQIDMLRALLREPGASGYHMVMRNLYGDEKTQGVRMVRLFRNLPGVAFQNRIHEQISPSLAAAAQPLGLALSSCELVIEHLGYRDEVVKSRKKDDRNEHLFRLHLEEHPDDIYMLYKLGDFLRRLPGRGAESLAALERALELTFALPAADRRAIPYAGEIAALCALEHAREDRLGVAESIVERALAQLVPTPNLHYIAAGIALHTQRNDEAIAHYRRCLAYAGQTLIVPIQEGITGHVSFAGIAQAWLQKGHHEKARRMLEHARALCPSYDVTAMALSKLQFQLGEFGASVRTLTDFLTEHPSSAGACQQATLILAKLGMVEQARAMGGRAIALLEESAQLNEARKLKESVAALN
jgi:tetratricopeptide (TPR) repeat protein